MYWDVKRGYLGAYHTDGMHIPELIPKLVDELRNSLPGIFKKEYELVSSPCLYLILLSYQDNFRPIPDHRTHTSFILP